MRKVLAALDPDNLASPCGPRVLFLIAHPDDEWLGAGSLIPHVRDLWIVQVTDGAPRDMRDARDLGFRTRKTYASARRREAQCALRSSRIGVSRRIELGLVDQEAALYLGALERRFDAVLEQLHPDLVLTHAYEGGHPDHDAVAYAASRAVARASRVRGRAPRVVEMAGYHSGARGEMETGVFLPAGRAQGPVDEERVRVLLPHEREQKARALGFFASQRRTVELFPLETERYRTAPAYDFHLPPHEGPLLYERLGLGMTWDRFRAIVEGAAPSSHSKAIA